MKGVIKTKENGQYTDAVRATYQNLVMMGVGINNIEHVVHTVLTNFTKSVQTLFTLFLYIFKRKSWFY